MTPWNAAHEFMESRNGTSRNACDASQGAAASASFDPARTGDPTPASPGRGDLGVGYVGRGGAVGLPSRNPIGFAPPADPARDVPQEQRFRTEISFKRHHTPVSPMASSRFDNSSGDELEPRSADLVWPLPENGAGDPSGVGETQAEVLASFSGDGEAATEPEAHDEPAAEEPQMSDDPVVPHTDEKVPFYKRELSFRRRKQEPETEQVVTPVAEEPVVAEPVFQEPVFQEPVFEEPVFEEPVFEEPVFEEPVFEEPVFEEPVIDEPLVEEFEELVFDEPLAAEPAVEKPVAHVPFAGRPDFEDDPVADEPAFVDEPVAAAVPIAAESKDGARGRGSAPFAARGHKSRGGGRGKKVVGLKIGASQIAAAVVSERDGRHELVQLARRPIDSGLVVDGEVRDSHALAHELKLFFDEHSLPKKNVRIGVASNRIGVRTFEIAGIDDETRFDNAVRFKAHEVLPVAQHESVLDYRVLEDRPNKAGEPSRRVLLVVAPRDQVEPYTQVAQAAGIRLAGVDLEALSLLRAFVDPKPFTVRAVDDTATVIVSIGHESTTLLVAGGGVCEFTRVFDWGGGTLQDAIAQELEVHHAEAATILRHLSLSGPGRLHETLDEVARAKAIEAVRLRLTPFARELVSSLQFYQTQPDSLGIGEIVITGGTSHLEGLGEALHQMIGVSVRVGDPLARVTLGTGIDPAVEATIGSMAVPIGLAIEDDRVRSVNLLPSDIRTATRKRPSLVAVALPVAIAVPVAALGFMLMSANGQVGDSQSQLDAIRAEISALPTPTGPVIDASLQGLQAQRAQAVANVLGSRVPWDAVLRDVSRVLPENVWLTSLQAQVAATAAISTTAATAVPVTPGVPTAPTGALIDGFTYSHADVARLLARLATLPTLTNVTLTSSKVEVKGKTPIVHFQIAADLNTGGS